jgi:hypothetical protein
MADVWVLVLIVAFFALCVVLVRGCDRIIGPDADELASPPPESGTERDPVAAAQ